VKFPNLECFCLFIGHPRNGSSILGGMLDAHRNIVLSHELNVLAGIKTIEKNELLTKIYRQSESLRKNGRYQAGYKCDVGGVWQGRSKDVRVVGDKKADWTALFLLEDPDRLDVLRELIGVPVKFIHTIRNPFDNIATIFIRKEKRKTYTLSTGKEKNMGKGVIGYYFDVILKGILETKNRVREEDWIEVHNEDLITHPKKTISKVVKFLGQEPNEHHLHLCKQSVFSKPRQTRKSIDWFPAEVELVNNEIKKYDFLRRYDGNL
jgi:hypothetical protein